MVVHDFSTGKHKAGSQREQRVLVLLALFAAGLCVGVVVSWQLQLASHQTSSGDASLLAGCTCGEAAAVASNVPAAPSGGAPPVTPQSRALRAYLEAIAPQREVLVAVSDALPLCDGMLDTFLHGVTQAGVANYVVVSLDAETHANLTARGLHSFHMNVLVYSAQVGTHGSAVSALKFGIIKQFLQLGWAVLLSDIDVAVLQNPFSHLYRDHDVESKTDGFDAPTAYGAYEWFDDESMPAETRAAQKMTHCNLNSGLFYVAANARTLELMARIDIRVARSWYWDQTAYNEEIFVLSHDNYTSPKVTVRVMSIYTFMNSKVLFKDVRHRADFAAMPMPVTVHMNYHPDKHERMQAVFKYYLEKDAAALAAFPGGSEPGT